MIASLIEFLTSWAEVALWVVIAEATYWVGVIMLVRYLGSMKKK